MRWIYLIAVWAMLSGAGAALAYLLDAYRQSPKPQPTTGDSADAWLRTVWYTNLG